MRKLSDKDKQEIIQHYKDYDMKLSDLAKKYEITPRTIERVCKEAGVNRDAHTAKQMASKFRDYQKIASGRRLNRKRLTLPLKLRAKILMENPRRCAMCGITPELGGVLEIDHKDGDPRNNREDNLQILCDACNKGKFFYQLEKGELNGYKQENR